MRKLRRVLIAAPGVAALAMSTVLVAPAAAQTQIGCGSRITENTTLTQDIGPCPGDGLIVTASNIRLDLNGHRVIGAHGSPTAETVTEQVGIRLAMVRGVTVQNGEVRNFDAGVVVGGGSGNTLRRLNVHDNINHAVLGGPENPCDFGDGMVFLGSDGNRVVENRIANNGPLSGVSLVGDSDSNLLMRNLVAGNNIPNRNPAGEETRCGTGPDQGPMRRGRTVQDIGVRIEGPGANNNRVQNNMVTDNALTGIAVHGYICRPPSGGPGAPSNDGNTILANNVSNTGRTTSTLDPQANGIALLAQGPATVVCVSSNTTIIGNNSSNNRQHGIFLGGRGSHDNKITANTVNGNAVDGISLTGPSGTGGTVAGTINNQITGNQGQGNGRFDGADYNPNCDNNLWRGNRFAKVNQPCVSGPGR